MVNYNIFIFRRDLRLIDNKGLDFAIKNFDNIIPIFIFTPEQVTKKNKFFNENAIQFMCESLIDLDKNLKKHNSKLHFFHGDNIKILSKIIKSIDVDNIIFNMDYTPYAIKRDNDIKKLCNKNNIECHILEDYLLAPIGSLTKKNGDPYTVFTPFKNNGLKYKVDKPNNTKVKKLKKINKFNDKIIKFSINENILVNGGRKNGINKLKQIKNQNKYNSKKDILTYNTTHLSAYIKFGCVSIREVYWMIKSKLSNNKLIDQLFWREFYFYIGYYFPKVMKGKNFNEKYDNIKWKYSKKNYQAWCDGKTGYPIIDAGMRELNETGYMHNRARLFTSNFLNRILGMDWRWSELYYAQKLTDYDPLVNNGNHQWISSTGTDPKPYFQRLFNPWLQSQKFDKDCEYIKKWIPELKDVDNKEIHNWEEHYNTDIYLKPIVNYKDARQDSIKMYKKVL